MNRNKGNNQNERAYFAGGCFWCTEAIFERLRGVSKVTSGYAGGEMDSPSYEDVSKGTTGHAEAIEVEYDSSKISYEDLLYVFFHTHDPTTPNQQGADMGKQYRSAIYYTNNDQKTAAENAKKSAQSDYRDVIVTEIAPIKKFHPAESYHQDYYKNNPSAAYCKLVIDPKIKKLKKNFGKFLKK